MYVLFFVELSTRRVHLAGATRNPTANGVEHDVKEYPDAEYSFLNDHRDLMFTMMSVTGIGYHGPPPRTRDAASSPSSTPT